MAINESQKKVTIPYEVWDDNYDTIFKREGKNSGKMKQKKKLRKEQRRDINGIG